MNSSPSALDILDRPISLATIDAALRIHARNRFSTYYPDSGPLRRELYAKHLQFFAAGATHGERLAIAANRVGKTRGIGAYETTCHATGNYPKWWTGRRFDRPVRVWACGKTGETTRDIVQAELLGAISRDKEPTGEAAGLGTGMIPGDLILHTTPKSGGISNAIDTVWVRHSSGGKSMIGFKSYGGDRDSFEGTQKDLIWFDEEPPKDVYDEGMMRTMSTTPGTKSGMVLTTFTPLEGYTEVVKSFLESTDPDRYHIQIGWADAPHLTPEVIETMSRKYLPSQLKARSKGEPAIGEGAIYPIDIEDVLVDDFAVPAHWPRVFGMDVGKTAVVWGALNRETDTLIVWSEYYSEEYNPILHATAIKSRGAWIPGVVDPGSLNSSQVDGKQLFPVYAGLGIKLALADNSVEMGIQEVWMRLTTGRLKFFRSCQKLQVEFSRYHRAKVETVFGIQAKIVKKYDHLLDALRYMCMSGIGLAITEPAPIVHHAPVGRGGGWMG